MNKNCKRHSINKTFDTMVPVIAVIGSTINKYSIKLGSVCHLFVELLFIGALSSWLQCTWKISQMWRKEGGKWE